MLAFLASLFPFCDPDFNLRVNRDAGTAPSSSPR
jgi:hypothetical protein